MEVRSVKQLSGLDAAFIYAETQTTPMNVVATVVIDRGEPPEALRYEQIVERLTKRLPRLPLFRKKLLEMPLGLDHPVWIEDPDFQLEDHLLRVVAPPPGTRRELAQVVARAAATRLERSRPLWEMWVVEGLESNRLALVIKVHHAALDGVSGAAMMLNLFDCVSDEVPARTDTDAEESGEAPSQAGLVGRTLRRLPERSQSWAEGVRITGQSLARIARQRLEQPEEDFSASWPLGAPPTRFNGAVSSRRSVAYARAANKNVRAIRTALLGTVNEVVLAACTSSLRSYLAARDELPAEPLVASVPVSTRQLGDEPGGNRISAMLVGLPVHLADPLQRFGWLRQASALAKSAHARLGPQTIGSLAEFPPPTFTWAAAQLYSRWQLAARHRPIQNLMISNVPGPPVPLSLCGARVEAIHPHGPLLEGAGLNITVMSYASHVDVGVLACGKAEPDVDELADGVAVGIEELTKLVQRGGWHAQMVDFLGS
jgi:WS/DGAT/MGAT family acyltransferase